jgi:hypothetical protein
MTIPGIQLSLYLGAVIPTSAPGFIVEALQEAEITRTDDGPNGFQLRFRADRPPGSTSDYALLSSGLLQPFTRVVVTVAINATPTVLMDGFITHQELVYERGSGAASLVVTGEDVSALMDLMELSFEYPSMSDAVIVGLVLVKYTVFGVVPVVVPSVGDIIPLPIERVPQQAATDRQFLQQLAQKYGYIFHVSPGPTLFTSTAYWGPPVRFGTAQPTLSVDMGPGTNVESISFKYDALAPSLVHGMVQDRDLEMQVPVITLLSTRLPALAARPALMFNQPYVRNLQYQCQEYDAVHAYASAQATTDRSVDKVVTVSGELSTLRYGHVIDSPGIIDVRGAGSTYDGTYYVQSVTHKIRPGDYRQQFTLTREGTGTTTSTVQV